MHLDALQGERSVGLAHREEQDVVLRRYARLDHACGQRRLCDGDALVAMAGVCAHRTQYLYQVWHSLLDCAASPPSQARRDPEPRNPEGSSHQSLAIVLLKPLILMWSCPPELVMLVSADAVADTTTLDHTEDTANRDGLALALALALCIKGRI